MLEDDSFRQWNRLISNFDGNSVGALKHLLEIHEIFCGTRCFENKSRSIEQNVVEQDIAKGDDISMGDSSLHHRESQNQEVQTCEKPAEHTDVPLQMEVDDDDGSFHDSAPLSNQGIVTPSVMFLSQESNKAQNEMHIKEELDDYEFVLSEAHVAPVKGQPIPNIYRTYQMAHIMSQTNTVSSTVGRLSDTQQHHESFNISQPHFPTQDFPAVFNTDPSIVGRSDLSETQQADKLGLSTTSRIHFQLPASTRISTTILSMVGEPGLSNTKHSERLGLSKIPQPYFTLAASSVISATVSCVSSMVDTLNITAAGNIVLKGPHNDNFILVRQTECLSNQSNPLNSKHQVHVLPKPDVRATVPKTVLGKSGLQTIPSLRACSEQMITTDKDQTSLKCQVKLVPVEKMLKGHNFVTGNLNKRPYSLQIQTLESSVLKHKSKIIPAKSGCEQVSGANVMLSSSSHSLNNKGAHLQKFHYKYSQDVPESGLSSVQKATQNNNQISTTSEVLISQSQIKQEMYCRDISEKYAFFNAEKQTLIHAVNKSSKASENVLKDIQLKQEMLCGDSSSYLPESQIGKEMESENFHLSDNSPLSPREIPTLTKEDNQSPIAVLPDGHIKQEEEGDGCHDGDFSSRPMPVLTKEGSQMSPTKEVTPCSQITQEMADEGFHDISDMSPDRQMPTLTKEDSELLPTRGVFIAGDEMSSEDEDCVIIETLPSKMNENIQSKRKTNKQQRRKRQDSEVQKPDSHSMQESEEEDCVIVETLPPEMMDNPKSQNRSDNIVTNTADNLEPRKRPVKTVTKPADKHELRKRPVKTITKTADEHEPRKRPLTTKNNNKQEAIKKQLSNSKKS